METFGNYHIQETPLSSPFFRSKVESFLRANGLRMEALDVYYTVQTEDGSILAGAGLCADVIKCVAVAPEARSEGLVAPLVSHILSQQGLADLKVFTKPEYAVVFESLGFHVLACAPQAVFLEKGRGLEQYCTYLKGFRKPGRCGVAVMNANPFTKGHRYLLEQAARQVDHLFVIPVREDLSRFSYEERLAMLRAGCPEGVEVLEGSGYQISAATFPTYFLKDLSSAAETQMRLDIDLFAGHIAPALGATVRFVGSEPADPLTGRYNALMHELLAEMVEIPRLQQDGQPISAGSVRNALDAGSFRMASTLTPMSTWPYLLSALAERALRLELDTPFKPGLVCPDSNGAHRDMDYALMQKGIAAIRPFFVPMALTDSPETLCQLGIEAEKAMLTATDGVNTHRGAIFSLGLALNVVGREMETPQYEEDMQNYLGKIARVILDKQQKDSQLHFTHTGARRMASTGYKELFEDWLPFYRKGKEALSSAEKKADAPERTSSPFFLQKLLLRIMSTLDDTCVIKRTGAERAQQVKREAATLLEDFTEEKLMTLCDRYAAEGISPGGAADMLALTIFIDSITR